mmetsp:Transcript_117319/g.376968  ORF Transcript_117319/g.376968 Transcript_117319/m.376968 type:complete len:108 (-) Transcript_117319:178-501(-)
MGSCMGRRAQRVGERPEVHSEVPAGAGGLEAEVVRMEEYLRYTKEEQNRPRTATSAVSVSRVQCEGWRAWGAPGADLEKRSPWQRAREAGKVALQCVCVCVSAGWSE